MEKLEFATRIRSWVWREPTDEEWRKMWNHHIETGEESARKIVEKIFPQKPEPESRNIVDKRIIPAHLRGQALTLEQHAIFSREMVEKFGGSNEQTQ